MDATIRGARLAVVLERRADLVRRDPAAAEPAGPGGERATLAAGHTGGGSRAAGRGRVHEVVDRGGGANPPGERGRRRVPPGAIEPAASPASAP